MNTKGYDQGYDAMESYLDSIKTLSMDEQKQAFENWIEGAKDYFRTKEELDSCK